MKTALLRTFGSGDDRIPLFGMITVSQPKGIDLVAGALARCLLLMLMLSSSALASGGMKSYWSPSRQYPNRLGVRLGFNDALSHQIQAGIDCH